jgi:hypothetical protein
LSIVLSALNPNPYRHHGLSRLLKSEQKIQVKLRFVFS